ncbi:alpha/beta fold hydrolase [Nonomuraea sp. 3N208]|uniref:alpha/beta fold hydrolase n=1 Tax=Nonomuraea sp. 3N208 TaxID=3457421 RepID=UPI003FCE1286
MSPLEPLDRPAWLAESVWPWPTGALTTPAGRLAVTDAGNGPVLLLIHTGMWSFVWRDLLRRLIPHFRCVTLDAPGNGRSYRPGADRPYEFSLCTSDLHHRTCPAGFSLLARPGRHDRRRNGP